jgi:hypothetical protein
MKKTLSFFGILSLALLSACGGGGGGSTASSGTTPPPPPASALSYQDPAATGFRFVKNTSASTGTHLVLDLIGPSGTPAKGVAFFMMADTSKVTWVHPTPSDTSGSHIAAGTVFPLGSGAKLLADKVNGNQLQVGIFQKGGSATTIGTTPILSLALNLNSSAAKGTVSFGPASGKQAKQMNADGTLSDITINVGTLSAQ